MIKKYIEDKDGNKVLPITHFSAVKNSSGDTLEDVLYTESTYNPTQYSGMGRKVLQKNMVGGVNTLTQDMMPVATGGNTIYIIRYDFTLGENITIPANSVLEFDGGSISGAYTLTGNNTQIKAQDVVIFESNIVISGTWNVPRVCDKWFSKLNGNILTTIFALTSDSIQNTVVLELDHNIDLDASLNGAVVKSNTNIILNGTITLNSTNVISYQIFEILNKQNVIIEGSGAIVGDVDTHAGTTGENGMGINIEHSKNIQIRGISISKCWGDGIYIGGNQSNILSENIEIDGVEIHNCRRQGISVTYCDGFIFNNLNIHEIVGTSPQAAIDIEPNTNRSVLNGLVLNSSLVGTNGVIILTPDSSSRPVKNIVFTNCYISTENTSEESHVLEIYGVDSPVKFENCHLDAVNSYKSVYVHDCSAGMEYVNCLMGNSTTAQSIIAGGGSTIKNCIIYGLILSTSNIKSCITDSFLYGKASIGNSILERNTVYGGLDVGSSFLSNNVFKGNGYLPPSSFYNKTKLVLREGCIVKNNNISYDGETNIDCLVALYNNNYLEDNTINGTHTDVVVYKYSTSVSDILMYNSITGYIYGDFKIFKTRNAIAGATRPTLPSRDVGYMFFDTSLTPAKPVYWTGSAWVDATGATV